MRVDDEKLQTYLGLYANDDSVNLSDLQFEALDKLFEIGYKSGNFKEIFRKNGKK